MMPVALEIEFLKNIDSFMRGVPFKTIFQHIFDSFHLFCVHAAIQMEWNGFLQQIYVWQEGKLGQIFFFA